MKKNIVEKELEKIRKREYDDDHLSSCERKKILNKLGIPYNKKNMDDVFVNEVLD